MKKYVTNILIYIQFFMLFIFIILSSIFYHSFNKSFYHNFYIKNNTAKELGLNESNLLYYTDNLLLYLKSNTHLDINWYTEKDILHMVDVKNLYSLFYNLNTLFIIIFIIINIILLVIFKKNYINILINKFQGIFFTFCFVIIILTVIISYNFNYFWIKFHEILFTNDLWLLSSDESNLIKMFPEEFFYTLITKIIITISIAYFILFIIKIILKKFTKFQNKNNYMI